MTFLRIFCQDGYTPLIYAVKQGRPQIVEILVAQGANRDIKDKDNRTALDHAHFQHKKKPGNS